MNAGKGFSRKRKHIQTEALHSTFMGQFWIGSGWNQKERVPHDWETSNVSVISANQSQYKTNLCQG